MTVDKNKYILSINGMSKSFGRNKVLKHISLNVKPGTIMGPVSYTHLDIGHNDSIARTRGVRAALGTGVKEGDEVASKPAGTNVDGKAKVVQDAKIDVDGKEFTVRELASQEMKNSAGATWDAATAGNAIGTWEASFGDQIDIVVSNNDGMGMSMFNACLLYTSRCV